MEKYIKISDAWDHDHCECCWTKFSREGSSDALDEGYATKDNYYWICEMHRSVTVFLGGDTAPKLSKNFLNFMASLIN